MILNLSTNSDFVDIILPRDLNPHAYQYFKPPEGWNRRRIQSRIVRFWPKSGAARLRHEQWEQIESKLLLLTE